MMSMKKKTAVVAQPVAPIAAPPVKKPAYLSNKMLLEAVIEAKQAGYMTDNLARKLQLLCSKYAKKGNFVNYSYNSDMQSYAMLMLVRTWNSFNPAKSSNPFAFFTQCIKNSFKQYLNQEKRQRVIKDEVLIGLGMDPSYSFNNQNGNGIEDEQDFEVILHQADSLKKQEHEFEEAPIQRNNIGEEIIEIPHDDDDIEIEPV